MKKNFKGTAEVYDQSFYIDTETGEGVDKVLAKIDPLLCKKASTTYIYGYYFEDIKQELVLLAMDGIRRFDPDMNVKLSTFLHIHIQNKLISKLRNKNKLSNDASSLNIENNGESKIRKIKNEIGFGQFIVKQGNDGNSGNKDRSFENNISENDGLFYNKRSYDQVDFEVSLKKLSKKLDYRTRKIIELMYFKDYSIKDAAEVVGLTGWAASMRLKKLANRHSFQSIFGQLDDSNGSKN